MAEGDAKPASTTAAASSRFGEGFLRDIWYFAALSGDCRRQPWFLAFERRARAIAQPTAR